MTNIIFLDGVKNDKQCPKSDDGNCPKCGEPLEQGYGFASGYGLGVYSYCDKHGFYDFSEDES